MTSTVVFAAPLLMMGLGIAGALATLSVMKRAQSPMTKIFSNTVDLFHSEPLLRLMPAALFVFMMTISAAFLLLWPLLAVTLLDLALWIASPQYVGHGFLFVAMWGCLIAGACLAAAIVSLINGVIAGSFSERAKDDRPGFHRGLLQALARAPSLLIFGLLWGFVLAMGTMLMHQSARWVRRALGPVAEMAVIVAIWALGLSFTMSSYFMILMIVREKMGPVTALRRAIALAKMEFGANWGEVFALKALDQGAFVASLGVFLSCLSWNGLRFLDRGPGPDSLDPGSQAVRLIAAPIAAAVAVAVAYYCVIQTLQIILTSAAYLYARDGLIVRGFEPADFDRVLGLRPQSLADSIGGKRGELRNPAA